MNELNSSSNCKKCKAKLINGVRCVRCSDCYHPSCAKLISRIKFLDAETIVCCATADDCESGQRSVDEKYKVLPDNADIKQLYGYIIYQKDLLIKELYDKIDLLQDKIQILEEKNFREKHEDYRRKD